MATTTPTTYAASFDMTQPDYLAAAGIPLAQPAALRGIPCSHEPLHLFIVADPRPDAEEGARVRVLAACTMRPVHPSIDAHGVAR